MPLTLEIASPCAETWESMTGDERVRHCAKCQMNVFNVKELTEAEVVAMLQAKTGRVCGRVFRRTDGTVLTKDCPVGVARLRRRIALVVAAVVTLLLAAIPFRSKGPACASKHAPPDDSLPGRVLARAESWKEGLRHSETFGPLIEWLDPAPVAIAGEIALPAPPPPAKGP